MNKTNQTPLAECHPRPRLLIVDDDENLLASLKRTLERGYEVFTAVGGADALGAIDALGPFTAIISDLKMPGMDGVELLSRVERLSPDTIRVLLTGYADLDAALDAVNQGHVFRILTKPCPPEAVVMAAEAAVRQHALVMASRELHALKRFQGLLEGVVQGFSALIEARDPYLAGHHVRTTDLACAIASELGMEPCDRETLRIAGLLHDIGKVYVPADFLSRPGLLLDEEFSMVKMHPEVGYDILKHLDRDWPVAVIIRQHHERMDGSGYPQGLTGRYIVLGARILAVADVVDAMCSHRPYRPSLGINAALDEIESGRGRLYDPLAVDACVNLFRNKGYSLAEPVKNV
jgi:putative nucleotidyltransferase with HDIG domain